MTSALTPLSTDFASGEDLKWNEAFLGAFQQRMGNIADQQLTRERIVTLLEKLLFVFVRDERLKLSQQAPAGGNELPPVWAKAASFGSTALKSQLWEGDIDVAAVVPGFMAVWTFFDTFPHYLQETVKAENIACITATRVPVLKFSVQGINVDMVFAPVDANVFPSAPTEEEMLSMKFLEAVAPNQRLSSQGVRTAIILKRVHSVEEKTYATVLRAIKLWSIRRHVYGNLYTFPGGVALAVLVAKICQLFPNQCAVVLFKMFFTVFYKWIVPKLDHVPPIYITADIKPMRNEPKLMGVLDTWDPKKESGDLLPILNPAYPYSNTCFAVGRSGLYWFASELHRANCILSGQFEPKTDDIWPLFWSTPFYLSRDFHSFILIEVSTSNEKSFAVWSGFIESRIKILIYSIEANPVLEVRPYPKRVKKDANLANNCTFVVGVRDMKDMHRPISQEDVQSQVEEFQSVLTLENPRTPLKKTEDMVDPVITVVQLGRKADWIPPEIMDPKQHRGSLGSKRKREHRPEGSGEAKERVRYYHNKDDYFSQI